MRENLESKQHETDDKVSIITTTVIKSNNENTATDSLNQEKETLVANNKDILNRVLNIVNEFQWPKSKISVHYTRTPKIDTDNVFPVTNEPLYTKAGMIDLPVSLKVIFYYIF